MESSSRARAARGVRRGLGKHAAEFDLARMRRLARDLAGTALGFGLHHRNAGAVHLDIEQRHGGGANFRQFQLFGTLDPGLLTRFDVGADGLGVALHGLGGHFNTSQQLEWLTALLEARLAAHHRHHAPHARRTGHALHVQFTVARTAAAMAVRAHIVGPLDRDRPQHRQHLLGSQLVKPRRLAAFTRHREFAPGGTAQQTLQHFRAEWMARGAGGHFDRFQVELTALAQAGEDDLQQRGYFPRPLALDRFGRFFSCSVSASSTGRARQIFSLTASSSRLSSRN